MERFVISIGRELGSGGKEIAEKVATRLGIKFYDKKLLEVAARDSGLDTTVFENADERESHTFAGNIFSIHGAITDIFIGSSCMNADQLFAIQSEAIRDLAERESCVIVGRCAEYVLRDHPRKASIFITADYEDRVRYVMDHDNVDRSQATGTIEKGDKRRRSYHDYYATTRWGEARCYDMCINSSHFGIEGTTDFICDYIKKRFGI